MNILVIVDHCRGISGPHRNVVGTLNALTSRSDVSLALFTGQVDNNEPYARSSRLQLTLGFNPKIGGHFVRSLFQANRLANNSDIIYVPTGLKSAIIGSAVARITGKPIVLGPNVTNLPIRKNDSPGYLELNLICDIWLEASDSRRDHVLSRVGQSYSSKIRRIHHAIDAQKFNPLHKSKELWKSFGISSDTIKVLHVGRDNEVRKGVRQLLGAIKILDSKNLNIAVDYIIVGGMSAESREMARPYKNVHFLGFKSGDELPKIMASSDISVIPSSWENMPFSVLESVASGNAVLASRTPYGGIPEIIEHKVSGYLTDIVGNDGHHKANAEEILANDLEILLRSPDLVRNLGVGARTQATTKFTEERLGSELFSLFSELINKKKLPT